MSEKNNIVKQYMHIASFLGDSMIENLSDYIQFSGVEVSSLEDLIYDETNWSKFRTWQTEQFKSGSLRPNLDHCRIFDQYLYFLNKKSELIPDYDKDTEQALKNHLASIKDKLRKADEKTDLSWFGDDQAEMDSKFLALREKYESQYSHLPLDNKLKAINLVSLDKNQLAQLNNKQIQELLVAQLEKVDMDSSEDRIKFFKFMSGFNNSHYTVRNKILLFAQCMARDYIPVCGSFNEWKERNVFVNKGEQGLSICVPYKYNMYTQKINQDGVEFNVRLPFPITQQEVTDYDEAVKEGKYQKHELTGFRYSNTIFSLNQTNMKEEERLKYIQRYNGHNTSEENADIYKRLKVIVGELGITLREEESNKEYLGYVSKNDKKEIFVKLDMPLDAKISVITHELGHFLMRHTNKDFPDQYSLGKGDREIQAQLVSHLVCEGVGVDTENESSIKYLNSYLGDNRYMGKLEDISKEKLFCHLQLVSGISNDLKMAITSDELTKEQIKILQNFVPDIYQIDEETGRPTVINRKEFAKQIRDEELKDVNKALEEAKNTSKKVMEME